MSAPWMFTSTNEVPAMRVITVLKMTAWGVNGEVYTVEGD